MTFNEGTMFVITIPKDRIGVLIGPQGRVKKRLEENAGVNVEIDSETGDVTITVKKGVEDPFLAIKARDIVHAIGRGFNPETSFHLLDEDIYLEIINLKVIIGDNPNKIERFRGRIIGRDGRAKKVIEETTRVSVSVYGNTVALIGSYERLRVAKEAIHMILDGSKHGSVYAFLEENAQAFRASKTELWDKASRDTKTLKK
ncbi:MAG: pre-rRNA-processing protein PNO1 [Candidatus Thorarchaeota archaeon]